MYVMKISYRDNAGTKAMAEQMKPWLDTWDDLTAAALAELEAVKAGIEGALAGLEIAEKSYTRVKNLHDQGVMSTCLLYTSRCV